MTKGRSGGRLHARRQVGEAATPGDDVVELAELLVAPMVAALGDELARDVELPCAPRSLSAAAAAASGTTGGGGLGSTRPLSGANASRSRQREPRALERDVAEIKPHRPRLGDLLRLVEIALCAVPVADRAAEGGAGEQPAEAGDEYVPAVRRPSTAS